MLADKPLRPFNAAFQCGDAQFVVLNPQDHLVTNTDAQPLAKEAGITTRPFSLTRMRVFSILSPSPN